MATKKAVRRRPANLNVRDARIILECCNTVLDFIQLGQKDAAKLGMLRIADVANRIQNRSARADARTGRSEKSAPYSAGAAKRAKAVKR